LLLEESVTGESSRTVFSHPVERTIACDGALSLIVAANVHASLLALLTVWGCLMGEAEP